MDNSDNKIDIAIVGGGILGLWSAYTLLKKNSRRVVVVFESEHYLGEHTSGRNSEVLHSGLYYLNGSMKHLHCLEGNNLWREFVNENQMSFMNCGKLIVSKKGQSDELEALYLRGVANSVKGLRRLVSAEIENLKNNLAIDNGFFIGSSAVLNVSEALTLLRNKIEALGGIVLTKSHVKVENYSSEMFVLNVNNELIYSNVLVNTAGLFSTQFRQELNLHDYESYYVKGCYLKLKKNIEVKHLVYPIPPSHGLGLGVHLTLDTAGGQKFGPDTQEVDSVDYSLNENLFTHMTPMIQEIFKNVSIEDLQLGYSGIRPKVKKNSQLVTDFVFNTFSDHGLRGYYEFLGIESPGVTASPSLAKLLVQWL